MMLKKKRVSDNVASVIARNAFTPAKHYQVQITNAQVMTEGALLHNELPKIGDVLDLKWIKEFDDQADYEIGKNFLSTNGEVLNVEEFPEFFLVAVKLLPTP